MVQSPNNKKYIRKNKKFLLTDFSIYGKITCSFEVANIRQKDGIKNE